MIFRFMKCCRRSGKASSRSNASKRILRRASAWRRSRIASSRLCAEAEREVLWVLNGHCNSPIAGHATIAGSDMTLTAAVLDETGARFIEASRRGPAVRPRELGRAIGLELLDKGAAEIIARNRPDEH